MAIIDNFNITAEEINKEAVRVLAEMDEEKPEGDKVSQPNATETEVTKDGVDKGIGPALPGLGADNVTMRDNPTMIRKQGPPGPPPRPGLQWKPETHRWIRPSDNAELHHDWNTENGEAYTELEIPERRVEFERLQGLTETGVKPTGEILARFQALRHASQIDRHGHESEFASSPEAEAKPGPANELTPMYVDSQDMRVLRNSWKNLSGADAYDQEVSYRAQQVLSRGAAPIFDRAMGKNTRLEVEEHIIDYATGGRSFIEEASAKLDVLFDDNDEIHAISELSHALLGTTKDSPVTVYRGIGDLSSEDIADITNSGELSSETPFASWTTDTEVAHNFAEGGLVVSMQLSPQNQVIIPALFNGTEENSAEKEVMVRHGKKPVAIQIYAQGQEINNSLNKKLGVAKVFAIHGRMNSRQQENEEPEETTLSLMLKLCDQGLTLHGLLYKAEEEVEIGQVTDDAEEAGILDLPEVPAENPHAGKMRALQSLRQVAGMLGEMLTSEAGDSLSNEEHQRIKQVMEWLKRGPDKPLSSPSYMRYMRKALDSAVSVKAIIRNQNGTLVLRDAHSDYWDLPGGHVKDGERLENALKREVLEETGLEVTNVKERFVRMLQLDSLRPVVFYDAVAKGTVTLSDEHIGYTWANDHECETLNLGVFKNILIPFVGDTSVLGTGSDTIGIPDPGMTGFSAMRKGSNVGPSDWVDGIDTHDSAWDAIDEAPETVEQRENEQKATERAGNVLLVGDQQKGMGEGALTSARLEAGMPPMINREDDLLGGAPVDKEGDGGGGAGIAGAGDGMVASDSFTSTGGGSNRKRDAYKGVPIIQTLGGTMQLKKAVVGGASTYDMQVIYKDFSKDKRPKQYIVAGYASPVIVDLEGHKISHDALVKDLPRFMADGGAYANLNIMHSNITVGKIVPEFTTSDGKHYKTEVDDRGLFVVAAIRTDEAAPDVCAQVIQDIEAGKIRSFSISGNAENPKFTCVGDQCFYDIADLQLYEITLCEEGVNQEAKFNVISKARQANGGVNLVKRKEQSVNETDLLKYFHAWKSLFEMHNQTGQYQMVLYDPGTGEVLLADDEIELEGDC